MRRRRRIVYVANESGGLAGPVRHLEKSPGSARHRPPVRNR